MKSRHILLASAIALALAACGNKQAPVDTTPADTAPAATETATPPPAAEPTTTAPATAATGSKPATVENCATSMDGNDAMQFNVDSITVPASCTQFTIHFKHIGTMAKNVMGHNVVIAKEGDMQGIATDGASVQPEHIKDGDTRVIAHTRMLGGGESDSVTFDVSKIKDGGPYKFFCSFPGHLALMQGSIQVQ